MENGVSIQQTINRSDEKNVHFEMKLKQNKNNRNIFI